MKVDEMADAIERHLGEIYQMFAPGSDIKLTFIARLPNDDEADVVMTIDTLDEIAKVIERSRAREAK